MTVSKKWAVGLTSTALAVALSPVATGVANAATLPACSAVTGSNPSVKACVQLSGDQVSSYGLVYDGGPACRASVALVAGSSVSVTSRISCTAPASGGPVRVTGPSTFARSGTKYYSRVTVFADGAGSGRSVDSPVVTAP